MGTGGSIGRAANGEALTVQPGSESRAEVWDGPPGNLRDPVRAHVQMAGKGQPGGPKSPGLDAVPAAPGAPRRVRRKGACGARNRKHKGAGTREREVVAPS
jgi:hypothetical protein